jgi:glutamate/tyrosine decarboxylase-like PLP-dependent enzyme
MYEQLKADAGNLNEILRQVYDQAIAYLQNLDEAPPAMPPLAHSVGELPLSGLGASGALAHFKQQYAAHIPASAGPRYFGLVIGGVTPAALAGDWLTSVFDLNVTGHPAVASAVEKETIGFLRQLFNLSEAHVGSFVSGATMANFVGLSLGRQWLGEQAGINIANQGLTALPAIKVFSGAPHACIYKCLGMLGIGKDALQLIPCLPGRQAVDIAALKAALRAADGQPCIVVANAGDVHTVDFDDLQAIAALKEEFRFWMHVDGAFGGFAGCSPKYQHLTAGLDAADSVAIDAHKWLNVPYDSGMQFTRHPRLRAEIYQNNAPYLGLPTPALDAANLTPEGSRRWRALAAWFSLMAYGREGYREIIERTSELAQQLGGKMAASEQFRLLAPVRMNVVCFTLANLPELSSRAINEFLAILHEGGKVALTPTTFDGVPALRAALSNWRTTAEDLEITWASLRQAAEELRGRQAKSAP